ncbi:MAG: bifunctional nuclease family protein [Anaerolineae bacterium]|nr:bifunctional nuclease family protein [Anaerolineae bacterium]NIN99372.1 bifunctional nuclease family protein [Anaerolineae bacterium]NIQ82237.1 bifunctional nuclease family protein [Anaerolineae bacterium]
MIRVNVDSVKVSMLSQHRVVVLKEDDQERYLPIWIGPFEADAITIGLQNVEMTRPLTHDLLKAVIDHMDASVSHIQVNDLRNDTFYAQIVVEQNGRKVEIDSRPSDAIALAVRVGVPIYVAPDVMDRAAIVPSKEDADLPREEEEKLSVFRDFVDTLDMDDLEEE